MGVVLTTVGKGIISNRLRAGGTEPLYVAWGTGAGVAAAGDTTLFTESSEARATGTSSQQTFSTSNDTYQVIGTITASAGRTITNAGLFDALTPPGNMFMKGDHGAVTLATGESIQYTFQLTFS